MSAGAASNGAPFPSVCADKRRTRSPSPWIWTPAHGTNRTPALARAFGPGRRGKARGLVGKGESLRHRQRLADPRTLHNARVEAWWWGGKCSFEIILKGGPGATGLVRPFVSPRSSAATDASAASKSSRSVQQMQPGTTRRKMEHSRFLGNEGALSRVLRPRAWLKTFGVQTNL